MAVEKGKPGRVKSLKDKRLKTRPDTPVRVYELSRQGLSTKQAAGALGIDYSTLKNWLETNPTLKASWDAGRTKTEILVKARGGQTFKEYVYGRLPRKLQKVWDRLCEWEEQRKPDSLAQKLIDLVQRRYGTEARQWLWLHALVASNFNMTEACRKVCVARENVEEWAKGDPGFGKLVDRILEVKKDFAEGCLFNLMAQGDAAATIFVNSTLNRDRGYDRKQTVEVKGVVQHQHLDVSALLDKLSPKAKRELLAAMDVPKALPAHREEIEDAEFTELES